MNKAIEEAKLWINNHSPHKIDCYEYTRSYMKDVSVVYRITDWLTFQSIVTSLGYDVYVDVCDNEYYKLTINPHQ
jgi:hypothetical protein